MSHKSQTRQLVYWDNKKKQGKLQGGAILKQAKVTKKLQEALDSLTEAQTILIKYVPFWDNKNKVERVVSFEVKERRILTGERTVNIEDMRFECTEHLEILQLADELKSALLTVIRIIDEFESSAEINKGCDDYIKNFECDFRHLMTLGGLEPDDEVVCLEEYKVALKVRAELKKAFLQLLNFKNGAENSMMNLAQVRKFISYLDSPNIGGGYSMRTADILLQDKAAE